MKPPAPRLSSGMKEYVRLGGQRSEALESFFKPNLLGISSPSHLLEVHATGGIEDILRDNPPVLYVPLDQPRDDHKDQHQHVNAGKYFIHQSRLLYSECKKSCKMEQRT